MAAAKKMPSCEAASALTIPGVTIVRLSVDRCCRYQTSNNGLSEEAATTKVPLTTNNRRTPTLNPDAKRDDANDKLISITDQTQFNPTTIA